jgi:hypothetical protein
MHVDVGPRAEWTSSLAMEGAARDLRTGADPPAGADPPVATAPAARSAGPSTATVLAEASVRAGFDTARRLEFLETTPPVPWAGALIGARAGGGFRRHLDTVVPEAEAGSLLRQVLDDMPAAALISGYAWMRLARRAGHHPASLMPSGALDRMTNLCSGWRAGGTAVRSVAAGEGVPVQDCPPAPRVSDDDPLAWHAIGPLEADWMRRRRCIDVTLEPAGGFAIWAMFRDTVGEGGGAEVVLHEYAVRVAGTDGVIEAIEAEPRVLPFPECPAAGQAVGALVGTAVGRLTTSVGETLSGIGSCTHLNDLLRALGGIGGLVGAPRAG